LEHATSGGRLRAAFNDAKMLRAMKEEILNEINSKLVETLLRRPIRDGFPDSEDKEVLQPAHIPTHEEREKMNKKLLLYGIEVVEKIPMYGYHPKPVPFLQIKVLNPRHIRLVGSILLSGAIRGIEMQPYESHISSILQCFIDNEVRGMDYIHFQNFKFRSPMPSNATLSANTLPAKFLVSSHSQTSLSHSISSPFIGASTHRLWWSENTDPSLISSFGSTPPTRSQEHSEIQTASQVLKGLNVEDLMYSQGSYGGENVELKDEGILPDHTSRSKCSLEIDVCVVDIVNDKVRLRHEENLLLQTVSEKFQKKKQFRYVHSLSEIWMEEIERARRMGFEEALEDDLNEMSMSDVIPQQVSTNINTK
jgi:hypothetical protein